ncbi:hypothetical protein FZEAL_8474 [Fusarium zealandicum]|uniref:RRM domain-containing protein n=1 Tax=Fusarium zealandicum TaxID=1053134 RepID=A0A8H4XHG4_9HYPO|nr:hypothetical protein FZEAL_8474 [Fusarium zealandicum]
MPSRRQADRHAAVSSPCLLVVVLSAAMGKSHHILHSRRELSFIPRYLSLLHRATVHPFPQSYILFSSAPNVTRLLVSSRSPGNITQNSAPTSKRLGCVQLPVFPQAMPAETTIQADVDPGEKTGIYYITICNLPFGTSWQQLKDWIRTACKVDHIEVFQNSTSGWVRVKGNDNFERAWTLLNGGVFNGRSIIASDKNRKQSIKIKELVDTSQAVHSQTPRYYPTPPSQYGSPTTPSTSPQYSAAPGQYYMAAYPQASGLNYLGLAIPSQGYNQQLSMTTIVSVPEKYATADPREHYGYNDGSTPMEHSAVMYSPYYQHKGVQYSPAYRGQTEPPAYYDNRAAPAPGASYQDEYIVTEPRKLHVSPFPQQARADEVKSWVRRKVDKTTIKSIEIPKNSNSKYLRGHVFVIFETSSAATTAMDQLNKARFQGRRVVARPTVEGVTADEPSDSYEEDSPITPVAPSSGEVSIPAGSARDDRQRSQRSSKHRDSKGVSAGDAEKKRPSSDKRTSSSSKKTSHSHSDKKSSAKMSSSSSDNSKDAGPVIVDGTTRKDDKR